MRVGHSFNRLMQGRKPVKQVLCQVFRPKPPSKRRLHFHCRSLRKSTDLQMRNSRNFSAQMQVAKNSNDRVNGQHISSDKTHDELSSEQQSTHAEIISGRPLAAKIYDDLSNRIREFQAQYGRSPGLAVIHVIHREDSAMYTRLKIQRANKLGIRSINIEIDGSSLDGDSQGLLIRVRNEIERMNKDSSVDGILLQLPLPKEIDEYTSELIEMIDPNKDVDGLTSSNAGKLFTNPPRDIESLFDNIDHIVDNDYNDDPNQHRQQQHLNYPCTALACIHLLSAMEQSDRVSPPLRIQGSRAAVLGRSVLVGKPIATMLTGLDATVTLCHSRTDHEQLKEICRQSDIIVSATGVAHLLSDEEWLGIRQQRTVIVDVGSTMVFNHYLGDAHTEVLSQSGRCSAITPVPGGVGPLTVAFLMRNTVFSALNRVKQQSPHSFKYATKSAKQTHSQSKNKDCFQSKL